MNGAERNPLPGRGDNDREVIIRSAQRTIDIERTALDQLSMAFEDELLSASFVRLAQLIVRGTGRLVMTGIGKSGIIARKIAATLTSTGTPALFLHPVEAGHGDLGMVTARDIVIALSWSGETNELKDVVNYCLRFGVTLIAMTSRPDSTLARQAELCITLPAVEEACPNRLAPTSSTIVQAALGDALAVVLINLRGFSPEDFRVYHPNGKLGARLLRLRELMSTGDRLPLVNDSASVRDAMLEMSLKRFGATAVVNDNGELVGVVTDGDLRRMLIVAELDARIVDHMTLGPVSVGADTLASEAVALMSNRKISQLFICEGSKLSGIVHLHDLLREGVV